jgi:hypothetical protein
MGGLMLLSDALVRFELDRLTATADKIVADGPVELGTATAALNLIILNSGRSHSRHSIRDHRQLEHRTTAGTFQAWPMTAALWLVACPSPSITTAAQTSMTWC